MRQGPTRLGLVVVLALSGASTWARPVDEEPPLPDSRLGHRTTPLLLLSRPDVRADLGLSADQVESARRAICAFYVQAAPLRGKPNTPETIRERRAVDDGALGWIDSRLTPEQKSRLVEIDLQWEGPSALTSRSVLTRELHLSPEQIATLKTAIRRRDERRVRGDAREADQILMEVAVACLTDAQRTSWRGMLGRPYTPQLAESEAAKPAR